MVRQASGSNRIVVDFDGTLVADSWPEQPEEFLEGAVGALKAFLEAGYDVVVSSTRLAPRAVDEVTLLTREEKHRERRYIRSMLDTHGLQEVGIWLKPWKAGAKCYIDDKAVRFDGSWGDVVKEVLG